LLLIIRFCPSTPEEYDLSASLRRRVLTVTALAAAPLLVQYPALADQASVTVAQSSVPSIAPGAAGRVDLIATNAGPLASFTNLTFTAPAGTKFADANLYLDGEQVTSASCALSVDDTTLSCADDAALAFPAGSATDLAVDVQVPADAAAAATLSGGSLSVPSVSSANWSFSVSTVQTGADGGAGTDAAAAAAAASPAGTGADAEPNGPAETNLVPASQVGDMAGAVPAQPSIPDGHHCKCDPDGSGDGDGSGGVGASAPYTVQMLATEYLRPAPNTNPPTEGQLFQGQRYLVTCKVIGQDIDGNSRWYVLYNSNPRKYFSARWAENIGAIPPFC
jgi:hypothetical protein